MHLSIQPKENVICVSMKSLKSFLTKEIIYLTKGQSSLTSVDIRANLPFYNMIARTKSYVSLWYFLLYFHWSLRFGLRGFCFALCFPKQKSSNSNRLFHCRILQGIFPVKAIRKWRHLFVWILIHCNLFVIRYMFWLKIAIRHETLSIKT